VRRRLVSHEVAGGDELVELRLPTGYVVETDLIARTEHSTRDDE